MSGVPCKGVDHTTTSGHDSRGGEQDANEREAGWAVSMLNLKNE
jgi:hypothetical protein